MGKKVSAEAAVKDIRRQTHQQHSAEEKILIGTKKNDAIVFYSQLLSWVRPLIEAAEICD